MLHTIHISIKDKWTCGWWYGGGRRRKRVSQYTSTQHTLDCIRGPSSSLKIYCGYHIVNAISGTGWWRHNLRFYFPFVCLFVSQKLNSKKIYLRWYRYNSSDRDKGGPQQDPRYLSPTFHNPIILLAYCNRHTWLSVAMWLCVLMCNLIPFQLIIISFFLILYI